MTVIGEELDAVVFEDRLLRGQGAGLLVFRGQVAGRDLAGFNIGLVEGVDADDGAGYGGGDFPAEEFLAQIVNVAERNADNGMPGLLQRRNFGVLSRVRRGFQTHVGEDAIVAVNLGRPNVFAVHRDDALALLAGGFRHQLFEPCAESGDSGRGDEGDLVAAAARGSPEDDSEQNAGILFDRDAGSAGLDHFLGAGQESAHVQTHERAGHHAKIRERGIAAADAGQAGENMAEVIGLGDLLHFRAGIGDGDEAAAGLVRADGLLHPFEEVLLENIGLERGAGLAGDDEQRLGQVDFVFGCLDLRRIGGIEHVQSREACDLAEGHRQHVGAQTGTAHAQQQDVGEVFFLDVGHGGAGAGRCGRSAGR